MNNLNRATFGTGSGLFGVGTVANQRVNTTPSQTSTPSPDDLQKLICTFCKKYLSVPPILMSPDGETYKCGRCSNILSNEVMQRNVLYEISAKYMSFPCSESKKCREILSWENISKHEVQCTHRNILCPITNCPQRIMLPTIVYHFRNNHATSLYQDSVNLKNNEGVHSIALFTNNGHYFLSCNSNNNENISFNVYTFNSKDHKFSVNFSSQTCSIEYTKQCSILPHHEDYFSNPSLRIKKSTLLGVLGVNDFSKCKNIILKMKLLNEMKIYDTSYSERQITDSMGVKLKTIIQNLCRCYSCQTTTISKIKQCRNGHLICDRHMCMCGFSVTSLNIVFQNNYEMIETYVPETTNKTSLNKTSSLVKQSLSRAEFEGLKCSFCNKYLSVPPILTSDDSKINKCGRCVHLVPEQILHNSEIYEKLARNMQFPCSESVNCNAILQWGKADEHEKICPYKKIICPNFNCKITFETRAASEHFKNSHTTYHYNISATNFITVRNDTPKVVLIHYGPVKLFAYFKVNHNTMSFNIKSLSSLEDRHVFSISFSSETCKINFSERYCILPYEENSKPNDGLVSDKLLINDVLDLNSTTTSFKIHIDIHKNTDLNELALSVLREFECPVCYDVMNSSIELCSAGHSICSTCRKNINNCPVCRSSIVSRNLLLERTWTTFQNHFPKIFSNVNV